MGNAEAPHAYFHLQRQGFPGVKADTALRDRGTDCKRNLKGPRIGDAHPLPQEFRKQALGIYAYSKYDNMVTLSARPRAYGHSPRVISCNGFLVLVDHCNLQENSSSPVSLPTYVCCMSVCAHVCMRKSAIYARCLPQSLFTLLLNQGLLLSLQIQLGWLAANAGIHLSLSPCRGVASTSHCA